MKYFSRVVWLFVALTLALLCVGCNRNKSFKNGTVEDTQQIDPSEIGVVDWEETGPADENEAQPASRPTDSKQPTNATQATEATRPTETNQNVEVIQPTDATGPSDNGVLTWEQYEALSDAEKQEFFLGFATVEKFYEWEQAAKKDHAEKNKDSSVTGNGTLDLKDYTGNQR